VNVGDYLVKDNQSIKDAMRRIDRHGRQVAFVVDRLGRLKGSVSDGDIRRALLRGADINSPVSAIMHANPIVLTEKEQAHPTLAWHLVRRLQRLLPSARVIPAVDHCGVPTAILSCADLKPLDRRKAPRLATVLRVLVVGGAGFLGSHLVRKLLAKGYRVRVLDLMMFGADSLKGLEKNKGFELVKGDLRDISRVATALDGVDAVVNLAAVVGDPACSATPEDAILTNYLANKALAEACKYHQINRYIYASTCSVYGMGKRRLDENAPLNPVSLYARSKIQAEEGILSLEDANFSPTILRMATLHGLSWRMRFDLVVNTMTMNAHRDRRIFVHGGGLQWRPLLHVSDAAEAFLRCLEAPLPRVKGEIFNVGAEKENYQIFRIADIVARGLPGAKIVHKGESADARDYHVSFKKVQARLGFAPKKNVAASVLEIKRALTRKQLRNLSDPNYYNAESQCP